MGNRHGFSAGGAAFWAAMWGVGVAVGVALGAWLTVVGGTGAPGAESIEFGVDLVQLPIAAGGVVFVLHLVGQLIVFGVRSRRAGAPAGASGENE